MTSRGDRGNGTPAGVEEAEAARPQPDGMLTVEMPADEDAQPGAGAAPGLLAELQGDEVGGDDVVAADDALGLETEDLIEIDAPEGDEGRGGVSGRPAELGVEGGQDALAQVAVGRGDRGDAGQPQLVDETPLQGAIGALTAPARLRGVAEDVLDAQAGKSPPDLRGSAAIDGAAGGGRVGGPVRAIGIEGHGQAVALEDRAQGGHDGRHALAALVQASVEHALGRVVDDHDHGEPEVWHQGEPAMATAVEMQQLAETGPRLPAPAMPAARPLLGHQAGGLQGAFDERVAETHAVVAAGELVKVPDVEPLVALPIEG